MPVLLDDMAVDVAAAELLLRERRADERQVHLAAMGMAAES